MYVNNTLTHKLKSRWKLGTYDFIEIAPFLHFHAPLGFALLLAIASSIFSMPWALCLETAHTSLFFSFGAKAVAIFLIFAAVVFKVQSSREQKLWLDVADVNELLFFIHILMDRKDDFPVGLHQNSHVDKAHCWPSDLLLTCTTPIENSSRVKQHWSDFLWTRVGSAPGVAHQEGSLHSTNSGTTPSLRSPYPTTQKQTQTQLLNSILYDKTWRNSE